MEDDQGWDVYETIEPKMDSLNVNLEEKIEDPTVEKIEEPIVEKKDDQELLAIQDKINMLKHGRRDKKQIPIINEHSTMLGGGDLYANGSTFIAAQSTDQNNALIQRYLNFMQKGNI
jgi:hypothetical protein